ncbi:MAG: c-type cytochrome [Cellvibrionaceae bacterium]
MAGSLIRVGLFIVVSLLVACGDDTTTTDSPVPDSPASGNNPPPNTSQLSESAERGKILYESSAQGCVACHGMDGQATLFKAIDLAASEYEHSSEPGVMYSPEDYLKFWMPAGNPSICGDDCAADLAAYMDYLGVNGPQQPTPEPPTPAPEPPTPAPEPPTPAPEPPTPADPPTPEPPLDIQALMQTPELNCTNSSCHDSTPGSAKVDLASGSLEDIALRLVSQTAASQNCSSELLIDPANIDESLLLKLIDPTSGGQCTAKMPFGKTGVSSEHYDQFVAWVNELIEAAPPVVIDPPPAPEPPSADADISSLSIANRAKVLLHGGAVTTEELDRVTDSSGQLRIGQFRTLLNEWMQTPEFDNKLALFLRATLQQDIFNSSEVYRNQLGLNVAGADRRINVSMAQQTLRESFLRTAMRIVKGGGDFREVVTTRDWEVTTALLAMLSHADQQNIPGNLRFGRFPNLVDSDYSDWRTVRLTQGNSPANYAHTRGFLDSLRAIEDGDQYPLLAPRVGFFSTPIFIQNWETNEDNQFRINTNQTVITALGLSFEAGDTTVPNHLDGLDEEHANPGTDCFACHQHLDPMRNIFANHYNSATLRALSDPRTLRPDFAFHGERETVQTMDDFANALATHPYFATAWVDKLCQWANSYECDQSDANFQSLVTRFTSTNFDMQDLIVRLFSSPVFIQAVGDDSSDVVSINRRDHFCDALNVRLGSVREHRNLTDANTNYCGTNGTVRRYRDLIPNDTYVRGQVPLLQPTQNDFLIVKSVESLCDVNVTSVVGNGDNNTFSTRRIDTSLDDMVTYIMGIPTGSDAYQPARTTLQQVYDVSRATPQCSNPSQVELNDAGDLSCGFGLSTNQSLRVAWKMACSSPSLTALGL